MHNGPAEQKSFAFAVRIVNLYRYLSRREKEYVISKQILKAGTSIGANLAEAEHAQSKADYCSKLSIALKEADETRFWLRLLESAGYISHKQALSMLTDCIELIKMLAASVKTLKENENK